MRCGKLDFEVINSVFEHTVVFVAVHVFIYVIRIPLGVPHFAEDAAVGEVIPSIARSEPFGL